MLIGYARVSTQDQNLELQREALIKAGGQKVFEDKVSGTRADTNCSSLNWTDADSLGCPTAIAGTELPVRPGSCFAGARPYFARHGGDLHS